MGSTNGGEYGEHGGVFLPSLPCNETEADKPRLLPGELPAPRPATVRTSPLPSIGDSLTGLTSLSAVGNNLICTFIQFYFSLNQA